VTPHRQTRIGFIGFGTVARHFAPVIQASAAAQVVGALERTDPAPPEVVRWLEDVGVPLFHSAADLESCDVVVSLVWPNAALAAAERFASHAGPGQIYLDLTSTTPMVKEEIEALLTPLGAAVVDGVMTGAGTSIDGHKIPMYLSGQQAGSIHDLLAPMGFNAEVIGDRVGVAAALKMVRGIVIKGLDATCMEARVVAHRYGIHEALLGSLTESLDRMPIREFVDMLFDTHLQTCGRRAMEAADIEQTVRHAGVGPVMASATRRIFERSAGLELDALDHDSEREVRVRIVSELLKKEEG